jgi:hypothetical protein
LVSIERHKPRSLAAKYYFEKGYMAQPIPTPINRNKNRDQMMYFTRSLILRRLKNPNAMEMSSAKSVMD